MSRFPQGRGHSSSLSCDSIWACQQTAWLTYNTCLPPHTHTAEANGYCEEPGECLCKENYGGDLCTQSMDTYQTVYGTCVTLSFKFLRPPAPRFWWAEHGTHCCGRCAESAGGATGGSGRSVTALEQEADEGAAIRAEEKAPKAQ